MKKRKLKKKIKKIKKLEYRVNYICKKLSSTINSLNLSESHVMQCKEAITKLEKDNKYYKEWMDRSGVDYKSWFEGENNGN